MHMGRFSLNQIWISGSGDLSRVRAEFLSLSKCPHLEQIQIGCLVKLKDLKTLTINNNPNLKYIAPGFINDTPKLAALDLSNNNLFALEYETVEPILLQLRAIYLSGNHFNCHCSLRWLAQLLIASGTKVQDGPALKCANNGPIGPQVLLRDMAGQLSQECEPYILPLFDEHSEVLMGKNVSWLCKALGSHDLQLYWRLPQQPQLRDEEESSGLIHAEATEEAAEAANVVRKGSCHHQRACVEDNILTVRYLHPSDAGKYTCVAKNKFGQDQRKVVLDVKVNNSIFILFNPTTVNSAIILFCKSSFALLLLDFGAKTLYKLTSVYFQGKNHSYFVFYLRHFFRRKVPLLLILEVLVCSEFFEFLSRS